MSRWFLLIWPAIALIGCGATSQPNLACSARPNERAAIERQGFGLLFQNKLQALWWQHVGDEVSHTSYGRTLRKDPIR